MKDLRRLQIVQVEILDEIHRLCEKYSLKYYLIAGTLLGAVRHKGFIPWDDDLDICMPRQDYIKFCDLCMTELNSKYYLHNIMTDQNFWLPFAKIRKKNTLFDEHDISHLDISKEIFVDIFPLDDVMYEKSFMKTVKTLLIKRIKRIVLYKANFYKNRKCKNSIILMAKLLSGINIKQLTLLQIKLMTSDSNKNGNYYINYGSRYDAIKQTILKTKYGQPIRIEFENKLYYAPQEFDYILKRIYGDNYMTLPPIEKRITHSPVAISFNTSKEKNII